MTSPSGERFEIAFGDQRAVVVEVGGGLRSYEVGGTPVLDGYGEDEMCRSGRGQVLAPWPNRLHDGSYEFGGRRLQLPINDLATNGAIHGLVRWANWRVRDRDGAGVVMAYRLHPQPGYPFTLDIEIAYRLADDGLSVTTTATERRRRAVPYGSGAHPYLTLGRRVDDIVLRVPGRGDYDFREPRPIGDTVLDNCFGDLERDEDGLARATLDDTLTLWVDAAYGFLMVFTGDPLPDVNRRADRRRADDLPARRVPHRRTPRRAGAGRVTHGPLGHRPRPLARPPRHPAPRSAPAARPPRPSSGT